MDLSHASFVLCLTRRLVRDISSGGGTWLPPELVELTGSVWDTGLLSSWGSGWGRADRFQSPGTWYRTFQLSKEETIGPTSASTVSHTVCPVVDGTDFCHHRL